MKKYNTLLKSIKSAINSCKGYSLMLLMCFPLFLFGQVSVSGDYRTNTANTTWSTAANWQTYNGTSWVTASVKPAASNSVYIAQGHTVTLTGNEACNDLHLNTHTNSGLALGAFTLSINGKLRAYKDNSEPGTNDLPSTRNAWITSTSGKIAIVGNSRNLTNTNEWSSGNAGVASPNGFDLEINLTSGQTATLNTSIKARNITVVSGTLDAGGNRLSPDQGTAGTGDLTIQTGATVISSASGTTSQVISRTTSANSPAGIFNLNSGGTLRLTGGTPTVDMTTINLNGTVEYTSSSAQSLVSAFTTYTNLTAANSTKTAPVNITINGTFQLNQGSYATGSIWTYGPSSTLVYNNSSGVYGAIDNNHVYWPASNGPTNVTVQGAGGINLGVSRTVAGTFLTSAGTALSSGAALTLNGTCQINAGGYFINAPTYGSSSTLIYNSAHTSSVPYGRNVEWSSTSGAGYPNNVTLSNNTFLDLGANGGTGTLRQCAGTLTINTGSGLYMDFGSNDMTQPLIVQGNVVQSGALSLSDATGGDIKIRGNYTHTGTFAPKGRAVFFDAASGDQTITGATTFDYCTIDKTAGNVILANDITCNQILDVKNGKITTSTNKVIISSTGSITRTSGWINGNLQKNVATGATTRIFEIGDAANYTPLSQYLRYCLIYCTVIFLCVFTRKFLFFYCLN